MNSTVSGKEIPTLSYEEAKELGLLSGMDLLPRTDILQREVLAPSVFSSSRWCRRKLSVPELMDIFDFEVRVQNGILRRVKYPSVAFVKEPPGKLLHRLMMSESTPVSLEVVQEIQVNDDVSASSSEKPQVNHGVAESSRNNISAESPTHHGSCESLLNWDITDSYSLIFVASLSTSHSVVSSLCKKNLSQMNRLLSFF